MSFEADIDMKRFDLIVFGATASGAMAAIAASRAGLRVAILEPGGHVGGMVTGGLGHTDLGRGDAVIGGYTRRFFSDLGKHYGKDHPVYDFEPSAAMRVLRGLLEEARVELFFQIGIGSLEKRGARIDHLVTREGECFGAPVWIDASYEGDLMQAAGVAYVVGREGRGKYGESLAGRQDFLPGHHAFQASVPSHDETGRRLKFVEPQEKLVPTGEGDGKFQSYCYRLCLTDHEENRIPVPKPERFEPGNYELARRYLAALGERARLGSFLSISRLPNGKTDINSGGAVSTNFPGGSWEYPEATPVRRREIAREHLDWAHGLIWFLQHDPAVPERIRREMLGWGLCKDEFVDTGHWPHQLYVREGRRMLGEYVVSEQDLITHRSKYDSIGMAAYNIDIREVQWISRVNYLYPTAREEVFMEGYVTFPVEPWEIPYRALLPRSSQCENLIVPVCASMSSVAFASFRMEPQYMIAGHAAGTAAAIAWRERLPCQAVPITVLRPQLEREGQILSL